MRATLSILGIALGLAALAPAPVAADTALLVVNDRYRNGQNLQSARAVEDLRRPLQRAGFDVILVSDGNSSAMLEGLSRLLEADEEDRILVALVGHFARSAGDTWLVSSAANEPNLARIADQGMSLATVMEVAANAPGRSVVLLGQERRRIALGTGLGSGIGRIEPPNGVSAVVGTPDDLADLIRDGLLVPGNSLVAALQGRQGLRPFGFISDAVPFLPGETSPAATPAPQPQPSTSPLIPSVEEISLWNAARELNTSAAYRAYLDRFANGAYAPEARARIAAIEDDPSARAEAAETALDLSRAQRRSVQDDLTILGFDTRGVDGIFGSGTRQAIAAWQANRGLATTGFVDAQQIAVLAEQARVRRAQIAEEERLAREAAEREDRAYWQISGQAVDRQAAEAYLERYPDGLFAEQARTRLNGFDDADWLAVTEVATADAFRSYLEAWPNGRHVREAREAIAALDGPAPLPPVTGGEDPALLAREDALNLPPITRSILEQRLAAVSLDPGRIDGRFDAQTRRSIEAFQRTRGLPATGYFDQITVARLLAESFGGGVIRLDGLLR